MPAANRARTPAIVRRNNDSTVNAAAMENASSSRKAESDRPGPWVIRI